ncbi:MAG: phage terminase large subunit [Candidatus Caldarchaeum sp.]
MRYNSLIGTGIARWNLPLTESQKQVWEDVDTPNILFSGAYRAGKSEVCSRIAIRHALIYENARVGIFRNYLKSLKQSTLLTTLSLLSPDWVSDWSNTEFVATLINGSRISFFGCDDPDRIGSVELSLAFIDEAHEVDEEAVGMIRGRLSLPVSPWSPYANCRYLSNVRQLILAVNPKAKTHHLYERFFTDRDGHKVYFGNTFENTYLPPDYLSSLIATYKRPGVSGTDIDQALSLLSTDRAIALDKLAGLFNSEGRRNLLGLWGSSDLQWYPDLESAIVDKAPTQFEHTIAGVDWGYNNPRYLRIGLSNGRWYTHGYWSPEKLTPDEFIRGVIERSQDVDRLYLPTDQPGLIKQLRREFKRTRRAKMAVLPGISAISSALGKSLFCVSEPTKYWELFHAEMAGYERRQDRSGEILDAPNKVADHYPDALRYAWYSHTLRQRESEEEEWEFFD